MTSEQDKLIATVRQNHLDHFALYKSIGLEQTFYNCYWDGFTSFEDYRMYGDMFPFLKITENQKGLKSLVTIV